MLDTPPWLLDVPPWLLDAPAWLLDALFWLLDAPVWLLDAPFWLLDAALRLSRLLDAPHWLLDAPGSMRSSDCKNCLRACPKSGRGWTENQHKMQRIPLSGLTTMDDLSTEISACRGG